MNRLQTELQRLYPAQPLVLELARPASWEPLAKVWQGVQADLELPAPAIAVSGTDSYQLWFSFAAKVPPAEAMAFLDGLRARYLADVGPERIAMKFSDAPMPPFEAAPGRWSAFVTPDLATLFADEPCLDLPPGIDAQADLLSRLKSIHPEEFERAKERLRPAVTAASASAPGCNAPAKTADPRRFLLDVMNDAQVAMHLRIEAARALLERP